MLMEKSRSDTPLLLCKGKKVIFVIEKSRGIMIFYVLDLIFKLIIWWFE